MPVTFSPGQLGMATPFWELLGRSDAEMEAELADYARLGVDFVRTDLWWHVVQPTANGAYDWASFDKVVDAASRHGVEVVPVLNGAPGWADKTLASATAQQAFGKFAGAAAARYGDRIDAWEVVNEPNMAGITPAAYTAALKASHAAIKTVDPTDTVITGGLAPLWVTENGHVAAAEYLQQMYANGAKGHFDAAGYHLYTYPHMPADGWKFMSDTIHGRMAANGDGDKKVWVTEFGAPTAGGSRAVSQEAQAETLRQGTDVAHDTPWAGPVMWYSYKDRGGSSTDMENWFGLVGPDGEQKAAYHALRAIATADGGTDGGTPAPVPAPAPAPTETPTFTGYNFNGNQYDNTIVGNALPNRINGHAGNDTIKGAGADDVLTGGAGNDRLHGGPGNDAFDFNSARGDGVDWIADFAKGDRIDLAGIDANAAVSDNQAFRFIGSNWLAKAGDLGFYQNAAAGYTHVQGDVTGDGRYDLDIVVAGLQTFTAGDFLL